MVDDDYLFEEPYEGGDEISEDGVGLCVDSSFLGPFLGPSPRFIKTCKSEPNIDS